jgi:DNA-binding NarL/FixJ family response regulator
MSKSIQVLLADDHPLVRTGIRATLIAESDLRLVGEATNGREVQWLCRELKPDVLLLDLNMPGPSPTETMAYVREYCPDTHVIVLTAHDDDAYIRGLVAAGVSGYVLKDEASEAVVRAIRSVVQGNNWFSRSVVEKLARGRTTTPVAAKPPILTDRELEVLRLVVAGKTNQEIAASLGISVKTVEKHIGELFVKLGAASRVEAAVHAVRVGLV